MKRPVPSMARGYCQMGQKRRITGLYMLRRLWRLGLRKTAVGLRPLCDFSPPHFGPPQCYALLYRRAKTSYTAETLCEIWNALTLSNRDSATRAERRNKKSENSARRHPWRRAVYKKSYKTDVFLRVCPLVEKNVLV
jgi:hypothetical protein